MAKIFPTVGNWYQDTSSMQVFEIVAVDEHNSTIEVQYADGDIDEFEIESWGQLHIVTAAAPEDANAGYGASYSDPWEDSPNHINNSYSNPLELIEPEPFSGFDDFM
ncbi:DUF6763 family protein [Teredinibacter franksiae]|jgi:hypothetical protein|uniref:DUF6763 family protein n=1 Tax=Teredinibacter franksiae TaxID=2761453 RepID=UPI001628F784|nr:DUF6763 family protein [Teredinibacter franksiae]